MSSVENYQQSQKAQQLQLPLDQATQQIIGIAINNYLMNNLQDLLWRKVLSWLTLFDSLSGYTTTGTAAVSGSALTLTIGSTSGNSASAQKLPAQQNLLDYSKRIFFRCSATPATSNATHYIVVGQAINTTGDQYFGFKIVNGALYAVVSNNGTSNELLVEIATSVSGQINLEARYFPQSSKIMFFYDQTIQNTEPACVISNPAVLPIGLFSSIFHAFVKTTTNSAATLVLSYFEFMQQLNIVK